MYKCHIRKDLLAPQQVCQLCNLEGGPWAGECKSHRCWHSVDTLEEEGHNVMWRAKDAPSQMRERQRNRGPRIIFSIFSGKLINSYLVKFSCGVFRGLQGNYYIVSMFLSLSHRLAHGREAAMKLLVEAIELQTSHDPHPLYVDLR